MCLIPSVGYGKQQTRESSMWFRIPKHDFAALQLQLAEVRCAVASCDARAEPTLVVTCDFCESGAFQGLRSATTI